MGVISGIVSSIIIYLLVFQVKPRIKIGDKIAREIDDKNNTIYRFKIVNKTKFAIFNLNYTLHYCYKQSDGIINFKIIDPSKRSLFYIPPYKRNDNDDKHAVRISYSIDEKEYPLDDNAYLCFAIIATHELSNTSTYTEVNFYKKDIVDGVFETGNSVKVLSTNNKRKIVSNIK